MALTKQKRAKMEKLVSDVMTALDTTGANTKKYKDMFSSMSDAQFDTYFKKLFSSEDNNLVLDIVDYERDLKIENLEKASKILGVPLFEKVAMPFVNKDKNNPVITKYEVPVGYIHVKRVQQILSKKNTTSTEIASRSSMTGQVMGKDKNARDSDMENFSLVTLDAHETLREYMGLYEAPLYCEI